MDEVKHEGAKVKLAGREFIVPALSLAQVETLEKELEEMRKMPDPDDGLRNLPGHVRVIHAALSRNYPSVTEADLKDWLDLNNYRAVINAVMGVSGMLSAKEAAPGEAVPVAAGL